MFYSGLPIAEEQRYTGQQFLPAIANLQAKYAQQRFGLQDALTKITQDQTSKAYGIHQSELEAEEKAREFDRQLAAQEAASRRAASAAGGGGASPSFGLGGAMGGGGGGAAGINVNPADQALHDRMFFKPGGGTWSDRDLVNDYNATLKSARNGNANDIKKIQFYHSFRPDIFGATQPNLARSVTVNTGQAGAFGPQPSLRQQTGAPAISALGFR